MNSFLFHDLKHPLTTIQLQADLMLHEKGMCDRDQKAWTTVKSAGARAHTLISDWLDLVRLEGGPRPEAVPVDLSAWFQDLRLCVEPWLGLKNLSLATQGEATLTTLRMDPTLMGRVLLNLLDNAITHVPPGSTLTMEFLRLSSGAVQIVVSDEGPGIPRDLWERVFDIHTTLGRESFPVGSRQRHQGLGLAFCRLAIETMGGRIWVGEPLYGVGASFVIELPSQEGPLGQEEEPRRGGFDENTDSPRPASS